jgi:hypothetical protein
VAPPVPLEPGATLEAFGAGARGGAESGKNRSAAATRTWPVTQTGVWSLDFE